MLIIKYKYDATIDTMPTFNSSFGTYTTNDVDNGDGTITRTIEANTLPTTINFKNCTGLLEIIDIDTSSITDMSEMFYNCHNLSYIYVNDWDMTNVTSIRDMFFYCTSLTELDASRWDTSNITNIAGIFNGCSRLEYINLSNWDTSNITQIQFMFYGCARLKNISLANWKVNNVTSVNSLFYNCEQLQTVNLTGWSLDKIDLTENMFYNCSEIIKIVMKDSNAYTVNKILQELPEESSEITLVALGIELSDLDMDVIEDIGVTIVVAYVRNIKKGKLDINKLYLGSSHVKKIYKGEYLIYEEEYAEETR